MAAVPLSRETYPPDAEVSRVHDLFAAHPDDADDGADSVTSVFQGAEAREAVPLPPSAYRVLRQVVEAIHQGLAVTVVPQSASLSTPEAADLLGESRPTVIKWLEGGAIPFERTGNRRRVLLHDVLAYRECRRAEQYAALEALVAPSAGAEEDPAVELEQLHGAQKAVVARRQTGAGT